MPQIFDNIEKQLLPTLSDAMAVSERGDFCVGYFNLRGWRQIDAHVEKWAGGEGHCCRLLVGMQRHPDEQLRTSMSVTGAEEDVDNATALKRRRELAQAFRDQLTYGLPTSADEAGLRRLAKQITDGKLVVKLFLRHPLHAKLYLLFRHDLLNPRIGYLGSSNLTLSGLSKQGELNVDVMDHDASDSASGEVMERARKIALTALELDSELGQAYAVLGWIAFYYDWDWAASEQHYRRALAIDGQDFSARLGYAHLLSNTFRPDEAIRQVDMALAADPQSPLAGTLKSQFLFYAGRTREAHDQVRAALESNQAFWIAQMLLGRIFLQEGRHDEAIAAFNKAADAGGVWAPLALTGYAHGLSGNREQARLILSRLKDGESPPSLQAQVHLSMGATDEALAALERAYAERDVRMVFLGVDPMWAPLYTDSRLISLLTRMNFAR